MSSSPIRSDGEKSEDSCDVQIVDPRLKSHRTPATAAVIGVLANEKPKQKEAFSRKRKLKRTDELKENDPKCPKKPRHVSPLCTNSRFVSRNARLLERNARLSDSICDLNDEDLELYVIAKKMCIYRKIIAFGVDIIVEAEVQTLYDVAAPWRTGIVNVIRCHIEEKFRPELKNISDNAQSESEEDTQAMWRIGLVRIVRRNSIEGETKNSSDQGQNNLPSFTVCPLTRCSLGGVAKDKPSEDRDPRSFLIQRIIKKLDALPRKAYSNKREVGSSDFSTRCRLAVRIRSLLDSLKNESRAVHEFISEDHIVSPGVKLDQFVSTGQDSLSSGRVHVSIQNNKKKVTKEELGEENGVSAGKQDNASVHDCEDMVCSPIRGNSPNDFDVPSFREIEGVPSPLNSSYDIESHSLPTIIQEEFMKPVEEGPDIFNVPSLREIEGHSSPSVIRTLEQSTGEREDFIKSFEVEPDLFDMPSVRDTTTVGCCSFPTLGRLSEPKTPPPPTISREGNIKIRKEKIAVPPLTTATNRSISSTESSINTRNFSPRNMRQKCGKLASSKKLGGKPLELLRNNKGDTCRRSAVRSRQPSKRSIVVKVHEWKLLPIELFLVKSPSKDLKNNEVAINTICNEKVANAHHGSDAVEFSTLPKRCEFIKGLGEPPLGNKSIVCSNDTDNFLTSIIENVMVEDVEAPCAPLFGSKKVECEINDEIVHESKTCHGNPAEDDSISILPTNALPVASHLLPVPATTVETGRAVTPIAQKVPKTTERLAAATPSCLPEVKPSPFRPSFNEVFNFPPVPEGTLTLDFIQTVGKVSKTTFNSKETNHLPPEESSPLAPGSVVAVEKTAAEVEAIIHDADDSKCHSDELFKDALLEKPFDASQFQPSKALPLDRLKIVHKVLKPNESATEFKTILNITDNMPHEDSSVPSYSPSITVSAATADRNQVKPLQDVDIPKVTSDYSCKTIHLKKPSRALSFPLLPAISSTLECVRSVPELPNSNESAVEFEFKNSLNGIASMLPTVSPATSDSLTDPVSVGVVEKNEAEAPTAIPDVGIPKIHSGDSCKEFNCKPSCALHLPPLPISALTDGCSRTVPELPIPNESAAELNTPFGSNISLGKSSVTSQLLSITASMSAVEENIAKVPTAIKDTDIPEVHSDGPCKELQGIKPCSVIQFPKLLTSDFAFRYRRTVPELPKLKESAAEIPLYGIAGIPPDESLVTLHSPTALTLECMLAVPELPKSHGSADVSKFKNHFGGITSVPPTVSSATSSSPNSTAGVTAIDKTVVNIEPAVQNVEIPKVHQTVPILFEDSASKESVVPPSGDLVTSPPNISLVPFCLPPLSVNNNPPDNNETISDDITTVLHDVDIPKGSPVSVLTTERDPSLSFVCASVLPVASQVLNEKEGGHIFGTPNDRNLFEVNALAPPLSPIPILNENGAASGETATPENVHNLELTVANVTENMDYNEMVQPSPDDEVNVTASFTSVKAPSVNVEDSIPLLENKDTPDQVRRISSPDITDLFDASTIPFPVDMKLNKSDLSAVKNEKTEFLFSPSNDCLPKTSRESPILSSDSTERSGLLGEFGAATATARSVTLPKEVASFLGDVVKKEPVISSTVHNNRMECDTGVPAPCKILNVVISSSSDTAATRVQSDSLPDMGSSSLINFMKQEPVIFCSAKQCNAAVSGQYAIPDIVTLSSSDDESVLHVGVSELTSPFLGLVENVAPTLLLAPPVKHIGTLLNGETCDARATVVNNVNSSELDSFAAGMATTLSHPTSAFAAILDHGVSADDQNVAYAKDATSLSEDFLTAVMPPNFDLLSTSSINSSDLRNCGAETASAQIVELARDILKDIPPVSSSNALLLDNRTISGENRDISEVLTSTDDGNVDTSPASAPSASIKVEIASTDGVAEDLPSTSAFSSFAAIVSGPVSAQSLHVSEQVASTNDNAIDVADTSITSVSLPEITQKVVDSSYLIPFCHRENMNSENVTEVTVKLEDFCTNIGARLVQKNGPGSLHSPEDLAKSSVSGIESHVSPASETPANYKARLSGISATSPAGRKAQAAKKDSAKSSVSGIESHVSPASETPANNKARLSGISATSPTGRKAQAAKKDSAKSSVSGIESHVSPASETPASNKARLSGISATSPTGCKAQAAKTEQNQSPLKIKIYDLSTSPKVALPEEVRKLEESDKIKRNKRTEKNCTHERSTKRDESIKTYNLRPVKISHRDVAKRVEVVSTTETLVGVTKASNINTVGSRKSEIKKKEFMECSVVIENCSHLIKKHCLDAGIVAVDKEQPMRELKKAVSQNHSEETTKGNFKVETSQKLKENSKHLSHISPSRSTKSLKEPTGELKKTSISPTVKNKESMVSKHFQMHFGKEVKKNETSIKDLSAKNKPSEHELAEKSKNVNSSLTSVLLKPSQPNKSFEEALLELDKPPAKKVVLKKIKTKEKSLPINDSSVVSKTKAADVTVEKSTSKFHQKESYQIEGGKLKAEAKTGLDVMEKVESVQKKTLQFSAVCKQQDLKGTESPTEKDKFKPHQDDSSRKKIIKLKDDRDNASKRKLHAIVPKKLDLKGAKLLKDDTVHSKIGGKYPQLNLSKIDEKDKVKSRKDLPQIAPKKLDLKGVKLPTEKDTVKSHQEDACRKKVEKSNDDRDAKAKDDTVHSKIGGKCSQLNSSKVDLTSSAPKKLAVNDRSALSLEKGKVKSPKNYACRREVEKLKDDRDAKTKDATVISKIVGKCPQLNASKITSSVPTKLDVKGSELTIEEVRVKFPQKDSCSAEVVQFKDGREAEAKDALILDKIDIKCSQVSSSQGDLPSEVEIAIKETGLVDINENDSSNVDLQTSEAVFKVPKVKVTPPTGDIDFAKDEMKGEKKYVPCEFFSKDPAENADNNDPAWGELQKVSTDVERYRKVRERWRNLAIPDPNKDLTFRHRFAKQPAKPTETVVKPAVRHNRSRSCTSVYEKLIQKAREAHKQRVSRITKIQQDDEAMIYLSHQHNIWNRTFEQEINQLKNRHAMRQRELSKDLKKTIRRYEEYISEARIFQTFYQGLGSDEDKTLLTPEQEELLDESQRMYEAFEEIYKN